MEAVAYLNGNDVVTEDVDQRYTIQTYTDHAIDFIERYREGPFFVYVPHSMPHVPLYVSPAFERPQRERLHPDCHRRPLRGRRGLVRREVPSFAMINEQSKADGMRPSKKTRRITVGLLGVCCVLAGCLSTEQLADTLPDEIEEQIEPLETEGGVALRFIPSPDAARLAVNMGSVDLTLNRLFDGMLRELAVVKFDRIEAGSENRLEVAITYVSTEERRYMGTPMLYRVDMAVTAEVSDGEHTTRREFAYGVRADLEGYSIRSDQLYELLLRFIASIDELTNAHFPGP